MQKGMVVFFLISNVPVYQRNRHSLSERFTFVMHARVYRRSLLIKLADDSVIGGVINTADTALIEGFQKLGLFSQHTHTYSHTLGLPPLRNACE